MRRSRVWWAGLLVLVLMLVSTSAALAQGGSGDKFVLGDNYTLASGDTLNGNLFMAGGSAILLGGSTVNGDVLVAGGTVTVAGHVTGDINMIGGSVNLEDTAVVDGNLSIMGGSTRQASGAVVHGQNRPGAIPRLVPPRFDQPRAPAVLVQRDNPVNPFLRAIGRFFGAIGMGLLLALIGVVVLLVVPHPMAQVATTVASQPGLNFAAGLLTLVLAILIGVPLLIACGLGLLVWLVALLAVMFGWVAVGLRVGQGILGILKVHTSSSLAEVALGVFVITWLAWVVPCIGFLFGVVVASIGLGSVLLTRFGTQPSGGLGAFGGHPAGGPGSSAMRPVGPTTPASPTAPLEPASAADGPATALQTETTPDGPAFAPAEWEGSAAGNSSSVRSEPDAATVVDEMPTTQDLAGATADLPARPHAGSLADLEAIQGLTPELAGRLRGAGSTTLVALATADPETLATQAAVAVEQVRQQDWIGQARRLLG